MRGLGRLTAINKAYKPSLLPSSPLSTFAGGRGRGRGSGSNPPSPISFVPSNTEDDSNEEDRRTQIQHSSGLGHGGGGKPVNPTPVFPSFSPWVAGANPSMGRGKPSQPEPPSVNGRGRPTQPTQPEPFSVNGRGRPLQPEAPPTVGRGRPFQPQPPSTIGRGRPSEPSHQEHDQSKKPIFFRREEVESMVFSEGKKTHFPDSPQNEGNPPGGLFPGSSGAGRGKPAKPSIQPEKSVEVNRHIRPTASSPHRGAMAGSMQRPVGGQQLSRDEAVKRAREVLSRGGQEGGRGRGFRGQRGGRGRGMRARGGRGGRGRGDRDYREEGEDFASGLYLGNDADGEKLVKRIGEENYNLVLQGFEEMSGRVLPSPAEEAYYDALHTNYLIEFEPEYLMEEFGTNPDIDEKPPIPLRDALEKMKPFLMAYEGIQSQEEWEEIINATMKNVPYLKELIDHYSGPDRVTARQQNQELERVAKTLPENIPSSVKRFTDRALLSLQSNPGWGFDKKCQFMDKLAWEVSQQYK